MNLAAQIHRRGARFMGAIKTCAQASSAVDPERLYSGVISFRTRMIEFVRKTSVAKSTRLVSVQRVKCPLHAGLACAYFSD